MTTLRFAKPIDGIEEPTLLPEDWYVLQVVKPPKVEDNDKKKKGLSYDQGAGQNLVISLRTISDIPEYSGRAFTLWLPYPSEEDLTNYDGGGMLKYDRKMERIAEFADKATGCSAEGEEVTILPNAMIGIYITQGLDQQGQKLINNLDWFQGFMRAEDIGQDSDAIDTNPVT